MNTPHTSWIDYWSNDTFWKGSDLWKINTRLFYEGAQTIVTFKPTDSILNIGCGAGHLEVLLAPQVKHIHAVDICPQFTQACAEKCKAYKNVEVTLLGDNYTDLSIINDTFSLILCVSAVQYYNNIGEIEELIVSAQKIAKPGARMLIADLPLQRSTIGFIWDAWGSFMLGVRKGYLGTLIKTAWARWCTSSSYTSCYQETEQLYFTIPMLEALIERLQLNARIIHTNVSVYANRPSLLIEF